MFAELLRRYAWRSFKEPEKLVWITKSAILAILYMPSMFLSVHAFVPVPALMGVIIAFIWPNPAYSIFFQFGAFLVAVSLGTVLWYLFYLRVGRRK